MKHIALVASTLLAIASPAVAQWSENFDSYAPGWSDNFDSYATNTVLDGVGGWGGWDYVSAQAGVAVNTFARSGPNSLKCIPPAVWTDAVHPALGIASGKWRFTAWQYISSADIADELYFIVNNVYAPPNHSWTIELHTTGGFVVDDFRASTPQPIVLDQWVEYRVDIDLNADTVTQYYNGAQVSSGVYTSFQGGPVVIENLDLFSNGGTCYWDDVRLDPVLDGVGGWYPWDNDPPHSGSASTLYARSAPNSLLCDGRVWTDAVQPALGLTSGKWRMTAWQYIPAPLTGDVYLIVNNVYAPPNHSWTVQLHCYSWGYVYDDFRASTPQPLVYNQWVEWRLDVDLDNNTIAQYYNGGLVSQGVYAFGAPVAFENLDLFSSYAGGGTCYWDDISLVRREPRDIVAFDANGDGRPDLATANYGTNDVSLHLNAGNGTFPGDSYVAVTPADTGLVAIAAGDLDGDGAADDLAVAGSTSNTVCTILDPNSPSPTATSYGLGGLYNPVDLACGPVDAGPVADIVVACQGAGFFPGGLAVSMNGGAFVPIALGAYVKVVLADLDGDGDLDLAAIRQGIPDQIHLFENTGGVLSFVGAISLGTFSFARGLCSGDMDSINGNDLVALVPNPLSTLNEFRVFVNTGVGPLGPGRFTNVGPIATPGVMAFDVASGEFEQDTLVCSGNLMLSKKDVVIVNAGSGAPTAHHGFNGATFQSTSGLVAGPNPIACVVADFDGDGQDDVAIANQGADISVILTPPAPLADTYGTGCPGTGAIVPDMSTSGGLPVLGTSTFAVDLAQANPNSLSGLLISFACDDAPFGGCTLYVGLPTVVNVLLFSSNTGTASLPFPIPANPGLLGADAYMQWAVFDPNGAYASMLAFSQGLRIQVGQ